MPYGDSGWCRRNPDGFKAVGVAGERLCECGMTLVRHGYFRGRQDHPWRPPRVECDCGKIHQIVGLRCSNEEMEKA